MSASARRPWMLVLDWDGTITKADTTAMIGNACLEQARAFYEGDATSSCSKPWSYFSDAYMRDYSAWKATPASSTTRPKSIEDEVGYLSSSRDLEMASFNRVRDAVLERGKMQHFVTGTEFATWMQMKGRAALGEDDGGLIRDANGLRDLLQEAERTGNSWSIVSVSWSRNFIIGAARAASILQWTGSEAKSRIWCNELLADKYSMGGLGSGERLICSAIDKRAAFLEATSAKSVETLSIYVGDSTTDLGCLAAADIGICMRDEDIKPEDDRLFQTLQRLGIACPHISEASTHTQTAPTNIYWTTDFVAVSKYLHALG